MTTDRHHHSATLLQDGKVLLAGGLTNTSEIYDPAIKKFTASSDMLRNREWHTATLLPDSTVLVAGGLVAGVFSNECEIYHPSTGTWTATGNMDTARSRHSAVLLKNGKVLVLGGGDDISYAHYIKECELYDPATGTWANTGALNNPRSENTTTLLNNGKVLVTGVDYGLTMKTCELYDPDAGTWSFTSDMSAGRFFHTATLLQDGNVLVTGGSSGGGATADCEIYNVSTGNWASTGKMNSTRADHQTILLPECNLVLTMAGMTNIGSGTTTTAELFNPVTGKWTLTDSAKFVRRAFTSNYLSDNTVLITGGNYLLNGAIDTKICEVFSLPGLTINADTLRICKGDSVMLNASFGSAYSWTPGKTLKDSTIQNPLAFPAQTTTYIVSEGTCLNTDSVTVMVNPLPVCNLGNDTAICKGSTLLLMGEKNMDNYYWPYDGSASRQLMVSETGSYILNVTDNNCSFADTINIILEECNWPLYLPNSFTPNGDGINDVFKLEGENVEITNWRIFNRWGEILFEAPLSTGRGAGGEATWDGIFNKNPVQEGVYIYAVNALSKDGKNISQKGRVTLLR